MAANLGGERRSTRPCRKKAERITKTLLRLASHFVALTSKSRRPANRRLPPLAGCLWASQPSGRTMPHRCRRPNWPTALSRMPWACSTTGCRFSCNVNSGQDRSSSWPVGVQAEWNTLTTTNAVLFFDRIFRSMLEETLPVRNFSTTQQAVLPVDPQDRGLRFTLTRPKRPEEPLLLDALGGDLYGLTVNNLSERGIYRVAAYRPELEPPRVPKARSGNPLGGRRSRAGIGVANAQPGGTGRTCRRSNYRWVARAESIQLDGSQVRGQNLWKTLMSGVLACVLLELVVLSRPSWGGAPQNELLCLDCPAAGIPQCRGHRRHQPFAGRSWAHDHPRWWCWGVSPAWDWAWCSIAALQPHGAPRPESGWGFVERQSFACCFCSWPSRRWCSSSPAIRGRCVWLLFDGTDSMSIQDDLPDSERRKLNEAVAMPQVAASSAEPARHSRIEYVQSCWPGPTTTC